MDTVERNKAWADFQRADDIEKMALRNCETYGYQLPFGAHYGQAAKRAMRLFTVWQDADANKGHPAHDTQLGQ